MHLVVAALIANTMNPDQQSDQASWVCFRDKVVLSVFRYMQQSYKETTFSGQHMLKLGLNC